MKLTAKGHHLFVVVTVAATLAASTNRMAAQPVRPAAATIEDSIGFLQNTIARRTVDRDQLQRMLVALNLVDSVYKPLYPAWLVLDDDLRERINRAFRQRRPGVSPDTDIVVIANPERGQILDLAVGSVHLGRLDTRQAISDSLGSEILHGTYQKRTVDLRTEPPRMSALKAEPRYASLSASAFGIRLMFSKGLGLEGTIGRDEMGYHFWSAGDFTVRVLVYGLKLGVLLPFPYGYKTQQASDPLAIKPTLLAGSTGFSGEFEHPFGDNKAGVRLSVGDLYLGSLVHKVPKGLSAYSLHSTAQAFFSHQLIWGDDSFTLTGGLGFHQVTNNTADEVQGRVNVIEKTDFTSPLLRVDYARLGDRLYGAGVQYYSSLLFVSGWVEIVRNFLFLDVKYYTPLFHDPQPWEQKYFFMISPRIQITY